MIRSYVFEKLKEKEEKMDTEKEKLVKLSFIIKPDDIFSAWNTNQQNVHFKFPILFEMHCNAAKTLSYLLPEKV